MTKHTFKIAAIPADGVGKEVIAAGRRVLDTVAAQSEDRIAFECTEFPWGCEYYEQTGRMMAADGLQTLQAFDAGMPTVTPQCEANVMVLRDAICAA